MFCIFLKGVIEKLLPTVKGLAPGWKNFSGFFHLNVSPTYAKPV
jgi:hypothetical protein